MNARVIKVKFANPPREGKKKASIKTADDEIFGVWPRQLGLFQPGRSYKIEFEEHEYQGRTYRTITKCEPAADVEERTDSLVTPSQRSSPNHKDVEAEFVARLLAASIQACAVGHKEDDLIREARMLRSVYRQTFAG